MKSALVLFLAGLSLVWPAAGEKVSLQDMPAEVQAAIKAQAKGATVVGYSKDGSSTYEIAMKVGGRSREVTLNASGKVISVVEETSMDRVPAEARRAIQQAAGNQKVIVQTISENGTTSYEAHFREGGKEREVKVDAAGKPVT